MSHTNYLLYSEPVCYLIAYMQEELSYKRVPQAYKTNTNYKTNTLKAKSTHF